MGGFGGVFGKLLNRGLADDLGPVRFSDAPAVGAPTTPPSDLGFPEEDNKPVLRAKPPTKLHRFMEFALPILQSAAYGLGTAQPVHGIGAGGFMPALGGAMQRVQGHNLQMGLMQHQLALEDYDRQLRRMALKNQLRHQGAVEQGIFGRLEQTKRGRDIQEEKAESAEERDPLITSGPLAGFRKSGVAGYSDLPIPTLASSSLPGIVSSNPAVLTQGSRPRLFLPSAAQQRTERNETPFSVWREQNPNAPVGEYLRLAPEARADVRNDQGSRETPAQEQARIRSMNLAETQKNAALRSAENAIRNRHGLKGFMATEEWPPEASNELNEMKQAIQDEYETKLSNLGADVTHFDYLQQRQPQRTATRSAGSASQTGKALDPDNPDHRAIAAQILQEAGGDKAKARQIARSRGFKF